MIDMSLLLSLLYFNIVCCSSADSMASPEQLISSGRLVGTPSQDARTTEYPDTSNPGCQDIHAQDCLLCGRTVPVEGKLRNDNLLKRIAKACDTHSEIHCHRLCYIRLLASGCGGCFICEFIAENPGGSPSLLADAVFNGLKLVPENQSCQEGLSQLTSKEHGLLARMNTCELSWNENSMVYSAIASFDSCENLLEDPQEAIEKQDLLVQSILELDDRSLYRTLTTGSFNNHIIVLLAFRFNRKFFAQLRSREMVHFVQRVFCLPFFTYHWYTTLKNEILRHFVQSAVRRFSPPKLFQILESLVELGNSTLFISVVKLYACYKVQIPSNMILDLLFGIVTTNILKHRKKPRFIGILFILKPVFILDDARQQMVNSLAERPRRSVQYLLYTYVKRYSAIIANSMVPEPYPALRLHLSAIDGIQNSWIHKINKHYPTIRNLQEYFTILENGGFSAEFICMLLQRHRHTKPLFSSCCFVLYNHPETDSFLEAIIRTVIDLSTCRRSAPRLLGILRILLGARSCSPDILIEVLTILYAAKRYNMVFFCVRSICNRIDLCLFPDDTILRIFEIVRSIRDHSLAYELLLNLPIRQASELIC